MNLRQLQCLCAVVDANFNISRAADFLHATQPAVSKQLQQFEKDLGEALLLRQGGRPVALTEVGERVLGWARRAVRCSGHIKELGHVGASKGRRTIEVATSHAHANYVLLPAIMAFRRRCPLLSIKVRMGNPDEVAGLVRDGMASLGVTHRPNDLPRDTVAVPFLSSSQLLVMPTGHPLQNERNFGLEAIARYPLVIQSPSRPQGAQVARSFQKAGIEVKVTVEALDADVIKTYVGAGLGVGVIPAFTYSPGKDIGLAVRDVAYLFDPAVSVILLRRHGNLKKYLFDFIAELSPALDQSVLEAHMGASV
ncbi:LysR substrate-binding domain-containing protein [Cupriavidus basilensis]|uniref:LysR substrate-binding domain-containing protein n=1 Tax=Cupriavidus basilensis TaxID=68895 RepID=A0ABT6AVP0_9BURK|nr:LysR substrate-binding domain-containing protein [Cupriavidus basilensis]MDF3836693.1 LysR substrate-binding domain-containing protein [Cupriavidus basilensis]